jgi:hypothetical protein
MRFDQIIRKIIKRCINESTENFNEETIDEVWFFALDSIFKVKTEQMQMLQKLRD